MLVDTYDTVEGVRRAIAELVAAGAPVDVWGVGTDLGRSRDSPTVGGVYKLVSDRRDGDWRPVAKRSPDKATLPGPKQVFRHVAGGAMREDVLAVDGERLLGRPLLEPVMLDGRAGLTDALAALRDRTACATRGHALPRRASDRLVTLTAGVPGIAPADLRRPLEQHGRT